MWVGEPTHLTH